jgi:hypothetical protein
MAMARVVNQRRDGTSRDPVMVTELSAGVARIASFTELLKAHLGSDETIFTLTARPSGEI